MKSASLFSCLLYCSPNFLTVSSVATSSKSLMTPLNWFNVPAPMLPGSAPAWCLNGLVLSFLGPQTGNSSWWLLSQVHLCTAGLKQHWALNKVNECLLNKEFWDVTELLEYPGPASGFDKVLLLYFHSPEILLSQGDQQFGIGTMDIIQTSSL